MNNRAQTNISHVCGADQGEEMTLKKYIFMKSIISVEKWLSTTAWCAPQDSSSRKSKRVCRFAQFNCLIAKTFLLFEFYNSLFL